MAHDDPLSQRLLPIASGVEMSSTCLDGASRVVGQLGEEVLVVRHLRQLAGISGSEFSKLTVSEATLWRSLIYPYATRTLSKQLSNLFAHPGINRLKKS